MNDGTGTNPPEEQEPVVSLSEEESTLVQRIVRASRRDIEQLEIKAHQEPPTIELKMFALPLEKIDYADALLMDDAAWKQFFLDHPSMI